MKEHSGITTNKRTEGRIVMFLKEVKKNRFLYLLLAPALVATVMFSYVPYGGLKMAFQDYNIFNPAKSEWVGLKNFIEILTNKKLIGSITNTLKISIISLIFSFPASIVFALLLNEVRCLKYKKFIQTVSYLPHFLSWIAVIGIASTLCAKQGLVNDIIVALGGERVMIMAQQQNFVPMIIILTLWKGVGWGSIIYLSAIAGIDPSLYEAAVMDGAGRFKQVWHITLPGIKPTVSIMLIWALAGLLGSNFELVYGLQNSFINFEVISTIIYKQGIGNGQYGMTTALGLFQGGVNVILLLTANFVVKKITDHGLF